MEAPLPSGRAAAPEHTQPQLRQVIGAVDGAVIAMSNTAPTLSIGIGMGAIAGIVGGAIPAVVFLAFLPILGIASAYGRLNQVERNLGTGFVWVRRALGAKIGPWLGFQSAWVNVVGTTIYLAYGSQVCGAAIMSFARQCHLNRIAGIAIDPASTAQTTVLGLTVLTVLTWSAIRGADFVARFQTPLIIFEYLVLLGFCGYALFAGEHDFSGQWFNPGSLPSLKVLANGLVVSVYIFWGWDSAFAVTEETRSPKDAARAGFGALWIMLGMFLLAAISFERLFSVDQISGNASSLLAYMGTTLAKEPLAFLPVIAMLFSSVASLQAGMLPTARLTMSMSREGTLGPVWARLHRKYATPALGTLILCSISALLAVLAIGIGTLSQFISAAATAVGMLVSLYYALAGIACAVRFRGTLREGFLPALRAVVLPGLSALALLVVGGFFAVQEWNQSSSFAFSAVNGRFVVAIPATIILAGIVFSAWSKWVRKSPYFQDTPTELSAALEHGSPAPADLPASTGSPA